MKNSAFKKLFSRLVLLMFVCTLFMGTANAGLDYYEVFVGKKLIYKRSLNEPLNLKNLPLTQANMNDQLVINYYQCNAPNKIGSNRSITLKDENGNTIKRWRFDNKDSDASMIIPVKELLQIQKANKSKQMTLMYAATGRPEGQKLALIAGESKTVGFNSGSNKNIAALNWLLHSKFINLVTYIPAPISCA